MRKNRYIIILTVFVAILALMMGRVTLARLFRNTYGMTPTEYRKI